MSSSLRLLFDQNVPEPLSKLLPEHEIFTAARMGWGELSNGTLLTAAESAGFAAMITVDNNIRYQQNLVTRKIGILVLPTQKMTVLRSGLVKLNEAIQLVGQGRYYELDLPRPPLVRRPPPA